MKGMKTRRTFIGAIKEINLLRHLSFMLEHYVKSVMTLCWPFTFKCEAIESLLDALRRRTGLVDSWSVL